MRLAIPYDNGQVFQHFGRSEQFKLYEVNDGAVGPSRILETSGAGHSALVTLLAQEHVDVLICGGIVFEYFSYGFGFVGLTLFIMQQVAPGPHKMAHYAFGSSLANLGVMLPGMASGWLCDQVGYHRFFLWALMATIPIFLIAWRIPFAHPDTEEGAAQAVEKELTDE